MPINPAEIVWDEPTIDPSMITWDVQEAPVTEKPSIATQIPTEPPQEPVQVQPAPIPADMAAYGAAVEEGVAPEYQEQPQFAPEKPTEPTWGELGEAAVKTTPYHLGRSMAGLIRLVEEDPGGKGFMWPETPGKVSKLGKPLAEEFRRDIERLAPNLEPGTAKAYAYGAFSSVARNTLPMLAGVVTRSPGVALSLMSGQVGGKTYADLREQGIPKEKAAIAATGYGAAEYIGELVPVTQLLKPGMSFLKRTALSTITDIPGEMFTEVLQAGIDTQTISPDMTLEEAWSRMKDAGIIAAIAGPIQAGAIQPVVSLADMSTTPDQTMEDEIATLPQENQDAINARLGQLEKDISPIDEGQIEWETITEIEGEPIKAEQVEWEPEVPEVKEIVPRGTPEEIAEQLDVDYGGVWPSEIEGIPDMHQFTLKDKGKETTFTVDVDKLSTEAVEAKIAEKRAELGVLEVPEVATVGTQKFKKWFKGSKIIDKKGKPLKVYHGSGVSGLQELDPSKAGTTKVSDWGTGIYFTPSPITADWYRKDALRANDPVGKNLLEAYKKEAKKLGTTPLSEGLDLGVGSPEYKYLKGLWKTYEEHIDTIKESGGGEVYPVFISMQNPMIHEYQGITEPDLVGQAKAKGHDGIVVVNEPVEGALADYINEIIVFDSSQIKTVKAITETKKPVKKAPKGKARGMALPTTRAMPAGTAYVGLMEYGTATIPETIAIDAVKTFKKPEKKKEIIRREGVIKPLIEALDTSLYQGRIKGSKKLGFFRHVIEEVRVKKHGDLEVTAHEIAHLLDQRFPEIKQSWLKAGPDMKKIRGELKSISYDQKKIYEGFAEYVRLWSTQKEEAARVAPTFTKWWTKWVNQSKYKDALLKSQTDMHAWFAQTPVDRARSKIGPIDAINSFRENTRGSARQAISDDLHGIYRMERGELGGISATGPYETARLTRAALSIIDGIMDIGAPKIKRMAINDYLAESRKKGYKIDEERLRANTPEGYVEKFEYVGKGLKQIMDPVAADMEGFLSYAVGRSSDELMRQGRENLFTSEEISGMLKLETPAFKKAFEEYQVWNKAIVDFAQAKGIINPETRKLWNRLQYLPFYREGSAGQTKRAGGVEGNWKGIKKLTGGTTNLRPIMQNIIDNAQSLVTEALKNEARVKVANFADRIPGGAKYMARIGKDVKPTSVEKTQIEDYVYRLFGVTRSMVENGQVPESLIPTIQRLEKQFVENPEFLRFWMHGQAPSGDNVIAVLRKGKPTFYEVADPLLFRSIEALNRPSKHWFIKTLGGFRRLGQASITLSVDFMTANIARDTLMGSVMSRSGFIPFVDSVKGMKSRITKDQAYKDFIANGGGFASYFLEESDFKKHLARFYKKKGIDFKTVVDTPAKLLYFLETVTDSFEVSTRIGEYKKAIERGEHPRHAAYLAREVSTDFGMRGDSKLLNFFYDTAMFFKAGVNGIDRVYRGVAHDPNKGEIAVKVAVLALMSMMLRLINKDNPEYEDLADWDKDTHWHFFIPVPWSETPEHFRFPKIWEIGAVASVAERSIDLIEEKNPKQFALDSMRIIKDQFKLNPMPQAIRPLYEQATNNIGFIDAPIESEWMKDLQPWARAQPRGAKTIKEIGKATRKLPRRLQVPPARTEALIRGYLNTWAMYGLSLSDAAFYDDLPDMRVDDYPVLRRFYQALPAKHTKYQEQFYDMLREATELRRTMRQMDKAEGTREIADEIEERFMTELSDYKQLTNVQKKLSAIRAEMTDIIEGAGVFKSLTGKEKRKELDKRIFEKNQLYKAVVKEIKQNREGER